MQDEQPREPSHTVRAMAGTAAACSAMPIWPCAVAHIHKRNMREMMFAKASHQMHMHNGSLVAQAEVRIAKRHCQC